MRREDHGVSLHGFSIDSHAWNARALTINSAPTGAGQVSWSSCGQQGG